MTYEPANVAAFRERLLTHPGERQDVDYKASMPFGANDSYSLNLIKHIQGMTNASGGWLVIGFVQTADEGWIPDPSHTNNICTSYDPTPLTQRVNSSVMRGQRTRVTVHFEVHPSTGLQYPVIEVLGFERLPCICRSERMADDTGEYILRQNTIYLRRPSAETAPISTAQDWEDLINQCVRLRRDEFMNEFRDLFERMISTSQPSPIATEELATWIEQMRNRRPGPPQEG